MECAAHRVGAGEQLRGDDAVSLDPRLAVVVAPVLDRPDPPFDHERPERELHAVAGDVLGVLRGVELDIPNEKSNG